MEVKPPKCVSFVKRFNDYKSELFEQVHQDATYSPFDPELTIAGQPMIYIVNDTAQGRAGRRDKTSSSTKRSREARADQIARRGCDQRQFKNKHCKFLGRHIHYNLSESEIKEKIFDDFAKDVKAVKETPVNGLNGGYTSTVSFTD